MMTRLNRQKNVFARSMVLQKKMTLIKPESYCSQDHAPCKHFRPLAMLYDSMYKESTTKLRYCDRHCTHPNLPEPTMHGWKLTDGQLVPTLMSLPAVPEICLEVVSCSCTTVCQTLRCKCRKSKLMCTRACKCAHTPDSCMNNTDIL